MTNDKIRIQISQILKGLLDMSTNLQINSKLRLKEIEGSNRSCIYHGCMSSSSDIQSEIAKRRVRIQALTYLYNYFSNKDPNKADKEMFNGTSIDRYKYKSLVYPRLVMVNILKEIGIITQNISYSQVVMICEDIKSLSPIKFIIRYYY